MIDTTTFETYQTSLANAIKRDVINAGLNPANMTIEDFKNNNAAILKYPTLSEEDAGFKIDTLIYNPKSIDTSTAVEVYLSGSVLEEDTAAGEATRLALGTKYTLDNNVVKEALGTHPNFQLTDEDAIKKNKTLSVADRNALRPLLDEVLNIRLGIRHLVQNIIDTRALAEANGIDPDEAIKNKTRLIIVNENTAETIINELKDLNFLGLNKNNVYFMIQKSGHGYSIDENGNFYLDTNSEKRLYNHGGMKLQTGMDREIFFIDANGDKTYLSSSEYEKLLDSKKLLLSSNIEDLDYLNNAIDLPSIAIGLQLGEEGADMIMTALAQRTNPPQKGGFFKKDTTGITRCWETDGDPTMFSSDPEILAKIENLNKNFNMYPNPGNIFRAMRSQDLPVHPTVKGNHIYPQTPQGDLNLIANKMVVIKEEELKSINNLKEQSDLLKIYLIFKKQDNDPVFLKYLNNFMNVEALLSEAVTNGGMTEDEKKEKLGMIVGDRSFSSGV